MNWIKEPNRIYAQDDQGVLLAEIVFPEIAPGKVNINHTFVDERLRGQGIASQLMSLATGVLRAQGIKVEATCPYAVKWLSERAGRRDIRK